MFLDALTNIYLGLHKSKDGNKAEPIPKLYIYIYIQLPKGNQNLPFYLPMRQQ